MTNLAAVSQEAAPSLAEDDLGPLPARVDPHVPSLHGKKIRVTVRNYSTKRPALFGKDSPRKIFFECQVLYGEEHEGLELWAPMNYPELPGPSSRYYRAWTIANEGKPGRRDRMTPKRFLDSVFIVRCKEVAQDHRRQPLPEENRYTIIGEFVALEARGTRSR